MTTTTAAAVVATTAFPSPKYRIPFARRIHISNGECHVIAEREKKRKTFVEHTQLDAVNRTKKKKKEIACARLRNIWPDIIKQCVDRIKAIAIQPRTHTLGGLMVAGGGESGCYVGWKSERAHTHFVFSFVSFFLRTPIGWHHNWKRKLCAHPSTIWRLRRQRTKFLPKCVCVRATSKWCYHFIISFVPLIRSRSRWPRDAYVEVVDFQHAHVDAAAATTTAAASGAVDAAAVAAAAAAVSHHHRRRALPMKLPRAHISLVLWCALLRRDILHIVSLRLSSV